MLVAENVDSFKGCYFYSVNEVITNHINLDGLPQRTKRMLGEGHLYSAPRNTLFTILNSTILRELGVAK
jgi:hypothetical protein